MEPAALLVSLSLSLSLFLLLLSIASHYVSTSIPLYFYGTCLFCAITSTYVAGKPLLAVFLSLIREITWVLFRAPLVFISPSIFVACVRRTLCLVARLSCVTPFVDDVLIKRVFLGSLAPPFLF